MSHRLEHDAKHSCHYNFVNTIRSYFIIPSIPSEVFHRFSGNIKIIYKKPTRYCSDLLNDEAKRFNL